MMISMSDDKMKIKAVNDLKNVKRSLRKNSLYIACSFNLDLNESHIYNNIIYSTNYTHICHTQNDSSFLYESFY